jgi:DNA-binding XRE family transcriptional regulator
VQVDLSVITLCDILKGKAMINKDELRLRRAVMRLTQDELAQKLDITREHLNRIENGREPISKKIEKRYNKLFGKRLLTDILKMGGDANGK